MYDIDPRLRILTTIKLEKLFRPDWARQAKTEPEVKKDSWPSSGIRLAKGNKMINK